MKIAAKTNAGRTAGVVMMGFLLACACVNSAAQRMPEAIAESFFDPELIRQVHRELALTNEQKDALEAVAQGIEPRLTELQQSAKVENERLLALVKREKLQEPAVLDQSERVMKLECDIRRAQLVLLIKIKNILNADQQAKLRAFKAKMPDLRVKMRQAQDLAQKWRDEGRDLSTFESSRCEFQTLMRDGKLTEAEALLDKSIKQLQESKR